MSALTTLRRSLRRIEKRALRHGVRMPTVRRARYCDADARRCNIDFALWAQQDRKQAAWLFCPRVDHDRLRRQAFFHERAAHAVALYLANVTKLAAHNLGANGLPLGRIS